MSGDPFLRWLLALASVLLTLILIVVILRLDFRPVSAELEQIRTQTRFNTCLLLTPPEERDQITIADCVESSS